MGNRYREEVLRVELLPLTIDLSLFRKKKYHKCSYVYNRSILLENHSPS